VWLGSNGWLVRVRSRVDHAVRPGKGGSAAFQHKLFLDGTDVRGASDAYVVHVAPGLQIRVLDLVPLPEEESPITRLKIDPTVGRAVGLAVMRWSGA
jgi:hypothetical protein